MKLLSNEMFSLVCGGDAAATRQAGQNAWGEPANWTDGINMAKCVGGMTKYGPNWDCLIAAGEAARGMADIGAAAGNNTPMPSLDPMGNQTGFY